MSAPKIFPSPSVGLDNPSSSLIAVVLPAPLGPRNPKIEFLGTLRLS